MFFKTMSNNAQYVTAAVAAAGVLGSVYCAYRLYEKAGKKKLPVTWRHVGTLKDLHVYPVKSCGVIPLERAECTILGLKDGWLRDRVLCVVDDKYNFITARVYPELLLIEPKMRSSTITLEHPTMDEPINVNLAEVIASEKDVKTATIWGNEVPVYNCGVEASEWFTKLLNRPSNTYHLVLYASQQCKGNKDPKNKNFNFTKDDTGAFPDDTSYHLVNEASVEDMNSRMEDSKIEARQFRPNFTLTGCPPYDEDNWSYVKIGDNVFEVIMPCFSYRQHQKQHLRKAFGNSPLMGLQLSLRSGSGGVVTVNDPIYVA